MRVLTGASGILQVAHTSPDGRLHGHSYQVVGWWEGEPCVLAAQAKLAAWLALFDHRELPADMTRAEDIGRACIAALGCVAVDVNRPLEGVFARIEV